MGSQSFLSESGRPVCVLDDPTFRISMIESSVCGLGSMLRANKEDRKDIPRDLDLGDIGLCRGDRLRIGGSKLLDDCVAGALSPAFVEAVLGA